MKKIILILSLITVLFLSSCNSNNQQVNDEQKCPIIDCARPPKGCNYISPVYDQNNCLTNCGTLICEEANKPATQNNQDAKIPEVKEFTVEADDLVLYPNTLTVNRGDKVKITFKVRTEKIYYNGLDFRSEVFGDTGKVLPGGTKTVEFIAEKSFTYTSYWPASSREKATGKINVV